MTDAQPLTRVTGRITLDNPSQLGVLSAFKAIVPPMNAMDRWRVADLDTRTLDKVAPAKLLELLADLSPEVSRGLFDFLRFTNPGWEALALVPDTESPHPQGQATIDAFMGLLSDYYGSVDVVIGRLFTSAYLRGAILAELVLAADARTMLDLATPDPVSVRFQLADMGERGVIPQPGQWQLRKFVIFDRPTVRYIPIDPFPGVPYGRPIAAPAVFATLFMVGFLNDLRRVVAQQGWTRIDVSVDIDAMLAARPDVKKSQEAYQAFINGVLDEIVETYSALEPDDAFVHLKNVTVNRAVGSVDSSVLGGADALIKNLERMAFRALKSMPLLMGSTDGSSEANANRQWEVHAAGIKAIQHLVETLLERLLGLGLQAGGIRAEVRFRFAELRASEILRDAQTEAILLENAQTKIDAGWETDASMSIELTGHEPLAERKPEPVPPAPPPPVVADALDVVAEPGANRGLAEFVRSAVDAISADADRARQLRRFRGLVALVAGRDDADEALLATLLDGCRDLAAQRLADAA